MAAEQPGDRLLTPHRPAPQDLAAYFHTGGTIGVPKVAPHTHAMEVYMAWALGCTGAYLDDAVGLSGLPLFHVDAVHVTGLAPFLHGRPVVSLGPLGYRDKTLMAEFWQIIEHFKVTGFSGVPTAYANLPPVPPDVDISSLRAGAVSAAPLPKTVRTAFESSTRVPMLEGYGLTEATCATATNPAFAPPRRVGRAPAALPARQSRHRRRRREAGWGLPARGDRGPGRQGTPVFPGYLRPGPDGPAPDPAGKVFDGWLLTGDLGRVDEDGYVCLTGRAKDLIIRGGHNIDPRPIEESLPAHPEVTAAAVIGAPDPYSGEVPAACVVVTANPRATEDDLLAWAKLHAPEPAAAPKAVHIVHALPTTLIGKTYKPALLQDAVHRPVQGTVPPRPGRPGRGRTSRRPPERGHPHGRRPEPPALSRTRALLLRLRDHPWAAPMRRSPHRTE